MTSPILVSFPLNHSKNLFNYLENFHLVKKFTASSIVLQKTCDKTSGMLETRDLLIISMTEMKGIIEGITLQNGNSLISRHILIIFFCYNFSINWH